MTEQEPSARERMIAAGGWFLFLCQALAVSVEVFLHRSWSFGKRYMSFQAAAAMVLMFFYPALLPKENAVPMMYFLLSYVVICAVVRFRVATRRADRDRVHSFYSGEPRIMGRRSRLRELTVKRGIEPGLVFFTGVFLLPTSVVLGSYLMLAAFGLLVSVTASVQFERQRAMDLYDAYVEQRNVVDRLREMRGE